MAERDRKAGAAAGPRTADILKILREQRGAVSLQRLGRLLGMAGQPQLESRVGRLVRSGLLSRNARDRIQVAATAQVLKGSVLGHPDGYGFARFAGGAEDAFLHRGDMKRLLLSLIHI